MSETRLTPIITEPKLRVLGGKVTVRGIVTGHEEHEDGSMFETPPLVLLDLSAREAKTKATTYKIDGELK